MADLPSPATTPRRFRLPNERLSCTHHFDVHETRGYVIAGMYDDGRIGDLFVYVAKEGSTLSGMIRAWAIAVSLGLQYGVPLEVFAQKFRHMKFEPSGWTKTGDIPTASSILDYIFAWLERDFPGGVWKRAERKMIKAQPTPVRCQWCGRFKTVSGWERRKLTEGHAYIWEWAFCPDCEPFEFYHGLMMDAFWKRLSGPDMHVVDYARQLWNEAHDVNPE
jgi:hypothetical protein